MRKILSLSIVMILLSCGAAYAGPFGTEMGMKKEQLKGRLEGKGRNGFFLYTPPKKHSNFTAYGVTFVGDSLTQVSAARTEPMSKIIEMRKIFERIKKQLTEKYGQPAASAEEMRRTEQESASSESVAYIIRNDKGEATSYIMARPNSVNFPQGCRWSNNLPDNLSSILLSLDTESDGNLSLILLYIYQNGSEIAQREREAKLKKQLEQYAIDMEPL